MATGANGIPNLPDIPGLADFCAKVVHSSGYEDGEAWRGRNAIVVGTGNSGHDIAQDLHSSGAHVTLVQRSPTLVVSIEPSGQLAYALYDEGPPLEDCDLIASATPWPLARRTHYLMKSRRGSGPCGGSAASPRFAICIRARPRRDYGSSRAVWHSAESTRSIWRCRSRHARRG